MRSTNLFYPKHKWKEVIDFINELIKEKGYKYPHDLSKEDRKKIAGYLLKKETYHTCLDFLSVCQHRDIFVDYVSEKMIDESAKKDPISLLSKMAVSHYCDKIDDIFNQCYENINNKGGVLYAKR